MAWSLRKNPGQQRNQAEDGIRDRRKSLVGSEMCIRDSCYPVISGGKQPLGYWKEMTHQGQTITIARNGTAGYVSWQDNPFYLNDVAMALTNKNTHLVLDRYLYYFLKAHQDEIYEMTKHAVPPCLRKTELLELMVDLPDLATQKQIVNYLDHLNAITSDLTTGLPAAIKQAQKQYQYYLNQLLRFEKV